MASAGDAGWGASCWIGSSPLATLAQVGAVHEGVQEGGEFSSVLACLLDQPMTLEGEAGGQGWESVT
jgi:hypothetical protein